jgi:adenylate cyclase
MQRKLTVILSADVVGYSGLMERDEAGTLTRLKENRAALFDPRVAAHGGRIFKLMGDGVLIEFSSAVSAVMCALEIQDVMAEAEPNLPEDERLRYRIGINLGDVMIEGDDIYGDGVNVAARLQALAPVGGVALSRNVSDQVTGKVAASFEDLGQHTVKNIERPVHVFAARPKSLATAPMARAQKKPQLSICVLPFANMSGDSEQEYFSDGISEDIITDLSKVSALHVVARNTAFTFKGKAVEVPQVARHLAVSHVLEGSVRKAGNRVRITAQLIDGVTGGHVWAERWDRDLNDIFALQDEISEAIVSALKLRLLPEEKKAIEHRGTTSPKAYKLFLMARQFSITGNVGSARRNEAIIRICRRAVDLDPNYARAWALIARAQAALRIFVEQTGESGLAAAERAIALDPNLAEAHAARAHVLALGTRYEEALEEAATALALDPESYEVNSAAAVCYFTSRRFQDAIRHFEKASAVMDSDYQTAGMLLSCYEALGDRDSARRTAQRTLARAEKIVALEPENGSAMSTIVNALALLGETERMQDWIERGMLLDPGNRNMVYNFACSRAATLRDAEGALDLLTPLFQGGTAEAVNWAKADSDLDSLRDHPRYKTLLAAAEKRLAEEKAETPSRT